MTFITIRRSRGTKNYYLVDSYHNEQGRTLCYLGREQDQTDTLEKALAHWRWIERATAQELRSGRGAHPKRVARTPEQSPATVERISRFPSGDNAQAAKRAFHLLALRLHPDQGGSHEEFNRLRAAYDRATD